ncbi:MAG TPA: 16S rRNA (cytidine(1402)-2'-O)-methyltransferase [Clostridiaceae bacterium]|nr:16S rRNA (cytidine(1402)-2'-O)-methyltransferase [Clostridiaceae bacterium]
MENGKLYLVATPIGNPGDMGARGKAVLRVADLVLCEDTRLTGLLFSELGIKANLMSYYEHNAEARHPLILEKLADGATVALVTDAGMPLISDPGDRLVKLALEHGIEISVIPGPNAALTTLAASGLSTARFAFEGFLPAQGKKRRERIEKLRGEERTMVLYEAPHRLRQTLTDLCQAGLGARRLSIGRELTKRYEEYLYFTVEEANAYYASTVPRGEFTLVLEGKDEFEAGRAGAEDEPTTEELAKIDKLIRERLTTGERLRHIAREIAKLTGRPTNEVYERALRIQGIKPEPPRL